MAKTNKNLNKTKNTILYNVNIPEKLTEDERNNIPIDMLKLYEKYFVVKQENELEVRKGTELVNNKRIDLRKFKCVLCEHYNVRNKVVYKDIITLGNFNKHLKTKSCMRNYNDFKEILINYREEQTIDEIVSIPRDKVNKIINNISRRYEECITLLNNKNNEIEKNKEKLINFLFNNLRYTNKCIMFSTYPSKAFDTMVPNYNRNGKYDSLIHELDIIHDIVFNYILKHNDINLLISDLFDILYITFPSNIKISDLVRNKIKIMNETWQLSDIDTEINYWLKTIYNLMNVYIKNKKFKNHFFKYCKEKEIGKEFNDIHDMQYNDNEEYMILCNNLYDSYINLHKHFYDESKIVLYVTLNDRPKNIINTKIYNENTFVEIFNNKTVYNIINNNIKYGERKAYFESRISIGEKDEKLERERLDLINSFDLENKLTNKSIMYEHYILIKDKDPCMNDEQIKKIILDN